MLDDFIPMLTAGENIKILTADQRFAETQPKIDTQISFCPLVKYLKEKRSSVSDIRLVFYNYFIEKFASEPELSGAIKDIGVLEKHTSLLKLLSTLLFPMLSKNEKDTFALSTPYQFQLFYYSDCFRNLFMDEDKQHLLVPNCMPEEELKKVLYVMIYEHVLEKFYGIRINDNDDLVYLVKNEETGLERYYKIYYDRRFIDIQLKGELPRIENCAVCLNTFRILDLEKQLATMPLDLFRIEGFAVWVAKDVTANESLETIKKLLLLQNEFDIEIFKELKAAIQILVGLNDIEVGLMPFIKMNNEFVLAEQYVKQSIIGKNWLCSDMNCLKTLQHYTSMLQEHPNPMPITFFDAKMLEIFPFLEPLLTYGVRSYLYYPIQNSDGLLGLLELASPTPNLLTQNVIASLEPAVPLLSFAMLKSQNTVHNKIEKFIKEKFTTLQQSVEWKFKEVAWNELLNEGAANTPAVVFENVYPLYGAIDIRNSSLERNKAIQKDLKEHLNFINQVLDELQQYLPLALLDSLQYKNRIIIQTIEDSIMTEDEVRINDFIEQEVHPVFNHFIKSNGQAQEIVDHYFKSVSDNCNKMYAYRKNYDETLAMINRELLRYLEKEEEMLQKSYPHYFDTYSTDGVEYNIYIGQSIVPKLPFNHLYLQNIRLWQLKSMAGAARITHQLLPEMKVPMQTTQLILVHSKCITIQFRNDERRFQVEGSYNIRYEIIKKRLDKVCIKDTSERLTQPGKIAIVYFNQKEVQEYQQYIEFLQNKGVLQPGIEFLELEDLQGIKGLKAIRVDVNLSYA